MDHFLYRNNEIYCEDVPLARIAREVGTPTYVYSRATLIQHLVRFKQAFASYPTLPCFAVKANGNLTLLSEIFAHGFGADIVSIGEMKRVLKAGVAPERIVYSGVGKKRDDIVAAVTAGIFAINIESAFELELIQQVANELGKRVAVALRVNPNIDAKTHPKITTGLHSSKFGLTEGEMFRLADMIKNSANIHLLGLTCHIGSQITDMAPLQAAAAKMVELTEKLRDAGHQLTILNMGGGLGIRYNTETPPQIEEYVQTLTRAAARTGLQLVMEPGRVLVGNTAVLLAEVIGVKRTPTKSFVVVDAAMNDLIRPALYGSYHEILPVRRRDGVQEIFDIVGPVCESGDCLGQARPLGVCRAGDLLMVKSAGAYGYAMASNYNSRGRPAEVLVDGGRFSVINPREDVEQLWARETALF